MMSSHESTHLMIFLSTDPPVELLAIRFLSVWSQVCQNTTLPTMQVSPKVPYKMNPLAGLCECVLHGSLVERSRGWIMHSGYRWRRELLRVRLAPELASDAWTDGV